MNPVNSNNSYWSMIKPYALLSNLTVPLATSALHLLSFTSVEALRTVANGTIVLLSGATATFAFHDMTERGVQEDNVTAAIFGVTVLAAKIIGNGTQILTKKLAEVSQETERKLTEVSQATERKLAEVSQETESLKTKQENIIDQQIKGLQLQVNELKQQQQKFLESQKTLEALQKKLEQAKTEKEELQKLNNYTTENKNSQEGAQYCISEENVKEEIKEIKKKDKEVKRLQLQVDELKQQQLKFSELQKTLEALQKKLEQAKTEKEELQAEKEKLQTEKDSMLSKIERLYNEEVEQATELCKKTEELSKQEEIIRSLQEELKQAKQLQKTLNDTVKNLESKKIREENDAVSQAIEFSYQVITQANKQAPPPPPPPPPLITKNSSEQERINARKKEQVTTHINKLENELGKLESLDDIDKALRRLSNTETKAATTLTMINKQLNELPADLKASLSNSTSLSMAQSNSLTASILGQSLLNFKVNDSENLLNKRSDLEHFILAIKFKIEDLRELLKSKTSELSKKKTRLLSEITQGIALKATPQVEKKLDAHSETMKKIQEGANLKRVEKQELTEEEKETKRNQNRSPLLVAIEGFKKNGNALKHTEVNAHRGKPVGNSIIGALTDAINARGASLRGDSDSDDNNDDGSSVWDD